MQAQRLLTSAQHDLLVPMSPGEAAQWSAVLEALSVVCMRMSTFDSVMEGAAFGITCRSLLNITRIVPCTRRAVHSSRSCTILFRDLSCLYELSDLMLLLSAGLSAPAFECALTRMYLRKLSTSMRRCRLLS